jgi:hypothetical protein
MFIIPSVQLRVNGYLFGIFKSFCTLSEIIFYVVQMPRMTVF